MKGEGLKYMSDKVNERIQRDKEFLARVKKANDEYTVLESQEQRDEYNAAIFKDFPKDHPDRVKAGF